MKIRELFEEDEARTYAELAPGWKVPNVHGDMVICHFNLSSLKGMPRLLKGGLIIDYNWLTDLEGAPREIVGKLHVASNRLTSLKGAPERINGDFYCDLNKLTSFEHAPRYIDGDISATSNAFTSLHNIHKQLKVVNGSINLSFNPITSHILGVLLIDGVTELKLGARANIRGWTQAELAAKIVTEHLKERDVLACQDELIEAGLAEFAEL